MWWHLSRPLLRSPWGLTRVGGYWPTQGCALDHSSSMAGSHIHPGWSLIYFQDNPPEKGIQQMQNKYWLGVGKHKKALQMPAERLRPAAGLWQHFAPPHPLPVQMDGWNFRWHHKSASSLLDAEVKEVSRSTSTCSWTGGGSPARKKKGFIAVVLSRNGQVTEKPGRGAALSLCS